MLRIEDEILLLGTDGAPVGTGQVAIRVVAAGREVGAPNIVFAGAGVDRRTPPAVMMSSPLMTTVSVTSAFLARRVLRPPRRFFLLPGLETADLTGVE